MFFSLRDHVKYAPSHPTSRRGIAQRSNIRYLQFALLALGAFCWAASPEWLSANKKIQRIEANKWPQSRSIAFTSQELLALGVENAKAAFPGVLYDPELKLTQGGATANATVDFDRLRQLSPSKGDSTRDWLMSKMLAGRHPVSVSVEASSSKGQMTVHPTSVSIAGVTTSGNTLDFLIRNFILSRYPDAVIDKPFALAKNIERINVKPGSAVVVAK